MVKMNKSICFVVPQKYKSLDVCPLSLVIRNISLDSSDKKIKECYKILNIPPNSKQEAVRRAFLELAKKFHPDSGSLEADKEKFIAIENAFRALSKHNTGASCKEEVEKIVYDIRHTAPQHRQYLSYEGFGYGTPFQREKQWAQARAQKAANNVMEHRISKAVASDKAVMKKGVYGKKHDIKTKYGFDRLVEDLIQESMSKGEFENLSGKGKPLKDQNSNPYVDFTTHKLNEVLINNGFTPEWITMSKEIDQDILALKEEIKNDRMYLGPYPLFEEDSHKWDRICSNNRDLAKSINTKINTFNLVVPLLNKHKFHVEFEEICKDVLMNGVHSVERKAEVKSSNPGTHTSSANEEDDIFGIIFKGITDFFTFSKNPKKNVRS